MVNRVPRSISDLGGKVGTLSPQQVFAMTHRLNISSSKLWPKEGLRLQSDNPEASSTLVTESSHEADMT